MTELDCKLNHFIDSQQSGTEQQTQSTANVAEQRRHWVSLLGRHLEVLHRREIDLQNKSVVGQVVFRHGVLEHLFTVQHRQYSAVKLGQRTVINAINEISI